MRITDDEVVTRMVSASHLITFGVIIALSTTGVIGKCTFNLHTYIEPTVEPLIFKSVTSDGKKFEILWPQVIGNGANKQGVIDIENGGTIHFACLGKSNAVRATLTQTASALCDKNKLLFVDKGRLMSKDQVSCTREVAKSSVYAAGGCGPGNVGTTLLIGFQFVFQKNMNISFTMTTVCHNMMGASTLYSRHELRGASLDGPVKCTKRTCFSKEPKTDGAFSGLSPDSAFTQNQQKKTLDNILGPGAGNKYIKITNNAYFAKGHLAPFADYVYYSGQVSSNYYINVAPQWQSFNNGMWKKIESAVRSVAVELRTNLDVWTGTYGILQLENNNKMMKNIYLDPLENRKTSSQPSRLPVPLYFWKLVREPKDNLCIVILGYNNIYAQHRPNLSFCQEIHAAGWPDPLNATASTGYIYYCDYHSIRQHISYIPSITCTNVLRSPRKM